MIVIEPLNSSLNCTNIGAICWQGPHLRSLIVKWHQHQRECCIVGMLWLFGYLVVLCPNKFEANHAAKKSTTTWESQRKQIHEHLSHSWLTPHITIQHTQPDHKQLTYHFISSCTKLAVKVTFPVDLSYHCIVIAIAKIWLLWCWIGDLVGLLLVVGWVVVELVIWLLWCWIGDLVGLLLVGCCWFWSQAKTKKKKMFFQQLRETWSCQFCNYWCNRWPTVQSYSKIIHEATQGRGKQRK